MTEPGSDMAGGAACAEADDRPVREPRRRRAVWPPDAFSLGLVGVFFLLNSIAVLRHAMWGDEWFVWLVARYSPNLKVLFENFAHQGRPAGWYLIAWLVCHAGFYPVGLKIVHVLISTACVYLVARCAPFTRLQKALFAFGYFPFYEYGSILRDYALEMLFLFVCCAIFTARRRRPLAFGLALAGLFQTTPFGILIGLALGMTYVLELWRSGFRGHKRPPLAGLAAGVAVAAVSLLAAGLVMAPPADTQFMFGVPPPTNTYIERLFEATPYLGIWRSYCPIPFKGFWNMNLLDSLPHLQVALGALLAVAAVVLLLPRWTGVVLYLAGTAALIAFYAYPIAYPEQMRYQGHFFIVLLIACWIAGRQTPAPGLRRSRGRAWPGHRTWALTLLLVIHLLAGLVASVRMQAIPMSGGREAARIIQAQDPPDLPVIGDMDFAMQCIAGYLDRPIYIACLCEYGTFQKFDRRRWTVPLPPEELTRRMDEFMAAEKSDVILVVNYPVTFSGKRVEFLGAVDRSIIANEQFLLFRVKYRGPR